MDGETIRENARRAGVELIEDVVAQQRASAFAILAAEGMDAGPAQKLIDMLLSAGRSAGRVEAMGIVLTTDSTHEAMQTVGMLVRAELALLGAE